MRGSKDPAFNRDVFANINRNNGPPILFADRESKNFRLAGIDSPYLEGTFFDGFVKMTFKDYIFYLLIICTSQMLDRWVQ